MMKILLISDTHGLHEQLELPDADMIIHAGDISGRGMLHEVQIFLDWFSNLPYRHKIFIGGNHDFLLEREPALFQSMLNDHLIYLEDSGIEIEGIKIWGSPITPFFFNWAFNRNRGADIRRYWDKIPDGLDFLITHGPPLGYGDQTVRGEQVGCEDLLVAIEQTKPRYHVFGHIHEAYGIFESKHTTFVNASMLDVKYRVKNRPVVIEFS